MNLKRTIKIITIGRSPRRTLKRVVILALVSFLVFKFILLPVRLNGSSMEPTYRNGSINFIDTLRYRFREPRRGDIVAISMAGRQVMLFKRVVGLPGERVAFRDGALIINGHPLPEPYLKSKYDWNMPEEKIGPDEFFVVGDNRQVPLKTQLYGRVKRHKIVGGPLF